MHVIIFGQTITLIGITSPKYMGIQHDEINTIWSEWLLVESQQTKQKKWSFLVNSTPHHL